MTNARQPIFEPRSSLAAMRLALSALAVSGLAGCASMGLDFGTPAAAPAAARPLDYRADDLPDVIFALDVPTSVKPLPQGSVASFAADNGKAEKHLDVALVLVDGDAVDSTLPPLAAGRTYYLLGVADKDKAALRAAQGWLKALPVAAAPVTSFSVEPRLCALGEVDPTARISILPALAQGPALTPLVASGKLSNFSAGGLKPCTG